MKPDYDSRINAGLSKEEIAKISGCEDQEMQIRMLRKYRYKLLDEVHEKQQSLDAIDYMICKTKRGGKGVNQQTTLFSNEKLMAMIIPLFLEQLLIMLVGMADTLVVSYAGEAAVSGVSLVNQFNTIFIYLFTALASGGAVVISQYIGRKKNDDAGESASQLLSFSAIFSILIAVMVLIGNEGMLRLMFGKVEDSVMHSCITYLRISAYSYPALAVYNAGAALFRSIGKTSVTMYLSVISNIINVIGNFIGVFVLRAGVAGVAYPSLIARTFQP